MFEQPLLIYSDYCNHCMNFLNTLVKYPDLFQQISKLNIDPIDPSNRKRPRAFYDIQYKLGHSIKEVPTIIAENGQYVLSGQEAFKWLQYQIEKTSNSDIIGFNPNEMGSFSDSYAQVGSSEIHNNATEQTFKFINKPDIKIQTPQETSNVTPDEYKHKQQEREMFSNVQHPTQPRTMQHNFANMMNSMNNNMMNRGNVSQKQQDIEQRLKNLEAERNQILSPPRVNNVDFSQ